MVHLTIMSRKYEIFNYLILQNLIQVDDSFIVYSNEQHNFMWVSCKLVYQNLEQLASSFREGKLVICKKVRQGPGSNQASWLIKLDL